MPSSGVVEAARRRDAAIRPLIALLLRTPRSMFEPSRRHTRDTIVTAPWRASMVTGVLVAMCMWSVACGVPASGGGGGGDQTECRSGETCSCERDALSCSRTCRGGDCNFRCSGETDCDFSCPDGACEATCEGSGRCELNCPGGDCALECRGETTCILEACDQTCSFDCRSRSATCSWR